METPMFRDRDWKAKDIKEWRIYAAIIILLSSLFIAYKIGYNRGEQIGTKDTTRTICDIILKKSDRGCVDSLLQALLDEGK
jgi:hypothetical protein